jgi:N-methylhydantoinase B/oxoprolinase/acetone carboxylase alpha subunit
VLLRSPSGGGYGPSLERQIERVALDVLEGYVTTEAALRDYGVVVPTDGGGAYRVG